MSFWYRRRRRSKPKGLVWNLLCSSIIFILFRIDYVTAIRKGRLMVPSTYTAFSNDLHVQLQLIEPISSSSTTTRTSEISSPTFYTNNLSLQLSRIDPKTNGRDSIAAVAIFSDPRNNVTQIQVSCAYFTKGGLHELEIVNLSELTSRNDEKLMDNSNEEMTGFHRGQDERLRQQLDVRWPTPRLSVTPEQIGTYPQQPVDVVLTFPEVECDMKNALSVDLPEFWIELIYCGQEVVCNNSNGSNAHILYAEQVRGYPRQRIFQLRCELFGLAGHYVVQLRPTQPTPSFVSAVAYIRADWNEKFVFNVHARSIFPCDPHTGIGVLFEYPACILDQGDRVRLFAKLRADVASLKPPTSLHYVTEQRVIRGHHSLYFDCEFFSEKFVEYCFVYVSQAISGAVADIRMDCVPTLPVSDSDTGGWGPWSDWTPCSTTCTGGTRNRYRFCDSPPPRYGAKFCEGAAVETENCGKENSDSWECMYGTGGVILGASASQGSLSSSNRIPSDKTDVVNEIGPGCRCGCIVHLGTSKPRRMIASTAQSCPGRSFWLIQADDSNQIRFKVDFFRLLCPTQYVKVRNGDSLLSNLIAEYIGGTAVHAEPVISDESQILVEFFSDELAAIDGSCIGGFLAHAHQLSQPNTKNLTSITSKAIIQHKQLQRVPPSEKSFTLVHIIAMVFVSLITIISALLGAQYIFRYRKYHLAISKGDPDSPIHTPHASIEQLPNNRNSPPSRAISTTTLLSEVIYLVKIRPKGRLKHKALRESVDTEALMANETKGHQQHESLRLKNSDENDRTNNLNGDSVSAVGSISGADEAGDGSTHTLTNVGVNGSEADSGSLNDDVKDSVPSSNVSTNNTPSPPADVECLSSRHSSFSRNGKKLNIDATNVLDTPFPKRKFNFHKKDRVGKELVRTNKAGSVGKADFDPAKGTLLGNVKEDCDEDETESIKNLGKRLQGLSASTITLTNGHYSPAASIISTATIRTTNQKESKEKQNREKLLARPDSEFSLANPEDFELDYYDYNVVNAGAAPGSYLGMDPQYLVWIPPLDEGNIITEVEKDQEGHYEEILPHHCNIDPGSNTETPDEDENQQNQPPEPPPMNFARKFIIQETDNEIKNTIIQKSLVAALLKDANCKQSPILNLRRNSLLSATNRSIESNQGIPLVEIFDRNKLLINATSGGSTSSTTSSRNNDKHYSVNKEDDDNNKNCEKETSVVKSPSDNLHEYYELDDIKFADSSDDSNEADYHSSSVSCKSSTIVAPSGGSSNTIKCYNRSNYEKQKQINKV